MSKILPCHTLETLASQIVSHTLRIWRLMIVCSVCNKICYSWFLFTDRGFQCVIIKHLFSATVSFAYRWRKGEKRPFYLKLIVFVQQQCIHDYVSLTNFHQKPWNAIFQETKTLPFWKQTLIGLCIDISANPAYYWYRSGKWIFITKLMKCWSESLVLYHCLVRFPDGRPWPWDKPILKDHPFRLLHNIFVHRFRYVYIYIFYCLCFYKNSRTRSLVLWLCFKFESHTDTQ